MVELIQIITHNHFPCMGSGLLVIASVHITMYDTQIPPRKAALCKTHSHTDRNKYEWFMIN